jgi:hypothetical protein
MSIDLRALSLVQNPTERRRLVSQAFNAEDYIELSDVLITRNIAAGIVLKLIEEESKEGRFDKGTKRRNPAFRRTWRIKVISDEWGTPGVPGTTLEWKAGLRKRNEDGRKFTGWDLNEMARKGNDEEYVIYHAAVLDEDCCITVEAHDAILLLNRFGIHYSTGMPISKFHELGKAPKQAPDGSMKHKRNWLYAEVPPDVDPAAVGKPARRRGGVAVEPAPAKRTYNRKPKGEPPAPPESDSAN